MDWIGSSSMMDRMMDWMGWDGMADGLGWMDSCLGAQGWRVGAGSWDLLGMTGLKCGMAGNDPI